MRKTVPWFHFESVRPELAAAGVRLLYQGNANASAFLATVASDGGPRVHPVFPVLAESELWLFIVNMSPKYRDLQTNTQVALHTLPTPQGGEEFHLRGEAEEIPEPAVKAKVVAATGGRQGAHPFEALFRVRIHSALHTVWENWGTAQTWPNYHKWRS
jgi:Pyridoxamine 5'-phosphate oxidase